MSFRDLPAPEDARGVFQAAWSVEVLRGTRVLPDGCTDIVFEPARRRLSVVGVMTRAVVTASRPGRVFGLRLEPWAARAVLGVAAGRLRDRDLPLDTLAPSLARSFRHVDRVEDAVEALTLACIRRRSAGSVDPRVRAAAEALSGAPCADVESVARDVGVSPRQLHRLFLDHVGVAPRFFARVARLQSFVRDVSGEPLGAAAIATGYCDQAHLCREARSLAGVSPRALRADAASV